MQPALAVAQPAPPPEDPVEYEAAYVHAIYRTAARHFSHTRSRPWPIVSCFCKSVKATDVFLDCGCGNGRNMGLTPAVELGFDYSIELCDCARSLASHLTIVQADALQIPCRTAVVDSAICIAVIHHFSTRDRRISAFRELWRVLVPGGKALVTLWAREQGGRELPSDALVPWRSDPSNPVHQISIQEEPDVKGLGLRTIPRYYHMYTEREAREDAERGGFLVEECIDDAGNWALILRRGKNGGDAEAPVHRGR
ncbi:putative Methyltransferase [Giardia muris]|uniref:Putative Methyltransferase n=1 Tax=Giardia muris TaxID=5742 RepID=A0A4Z1SZB8_GIAMU|nr:putative Methyltransferase [Giardia muris]|eukprot:TNJ27003.1 putative Methyltransferase [Giardia muris]